MDEGKRETPARIRVVRRRPATLRSAAAGIVWPFLPAGRVADIMAALLRQFEDSQWWPADRLLTAQLGQLKQLLAYAATQVPFYRERLPDAGELPEGGLTPALWSSLPILRRHEVQAAGEALRAQRLPGGHGRTDVVRTSGSTGMPISVTKSALSNLFWHACLVRDHRWHGRDFAGRFAAIRAMDDGVGLYPNGIRNSSWGRMTALVHPTGPAFGLSIRASTGEQAEWLSRVRPNYLLSYPSSLAALARHCAAHDIGLPGLRGLLSFGEVCGDDTRAICRDVWKLEIADSYSTQEVGYIALQCPDHAGHYHVMGEDVLVEVLDDEGRACRPGEVGRVVVTPLHNFAMPLIRYEIGDLAEVGPPCPCGRGLPVLTRVGGRVRHMLRLPDGGTLWPRMRAGTYREIAPIRQFQLAQTAIDRLELRLVVERPLTADEEEKLRAEIRERLSGRDFVIDLSYRDSIPRSPGGKYEDVRCELPS